MWMEEWSHCWRSGLTIMYFISLELFCVESLEWSQTCILVSSLQVWTLSDPAGSTAHTVSASAGVWGGASLVTGDTRYVTVPDNYFNVTRTSRNNLPDCVLRTLNEILWEGRKAPEVLNSIFCLSRNTNSIFTTNIQVTRSNISGTVRLEITIWLESYYNSSPWTFSRDERGISANALPVDWLLCCIWVEGLSRKLVLMTTYLEQLHNHSYRIVRGL